MRCSECSFLTYYGNAQTCSLLLTDAIFGNTIDIYVKNAGYNFTRMCLPLADESLVIRDIPLIVSHTISQEAIRRAETDSKNRLSNSKTNRGLGDAICIMDHYFRIPVNHDRVTVTCFDEAFPEAIAMSFDRTSP